MEDQGTKTPKKDCIVGQVRGKYYVLRIVDGRGEEVVYDPYNLCRMTAKFSKVRLTEAHARRIVDKLNGPRGQAMEV